MAPWAVSRHVFQRTLRWRVPSMGPPTVDMTGTSRSVSRATPWNLPRDVPWVVRWANEEVYQGLRRGGICTIGHPTVYAAGLSRPLLSSWEGPWDIPCPFYIPSHFSQCSMAYGGSCHGTVNNMGHPMKQPKRKLGPMTRPMINFMAEFIPWCVSWEIPWCISKDTPMGETTQCGIPGNIPWRIVWRIPWVFP